MNLDPPLPGDMPNFDELQRQLNKNACFTYPVDALMGRIPTEAEVWKDIFCALVGSGQLSADAKTEKIGEVVDNFTKLYVDRYLK